jgi:hypothetical protein
MVELGLVREMSSYKVEIVVWRGLSFSWIGWVSLVLSDVSPFLEVLTLDRRVVSSALGRGDFRSTAAVRSAWSPAFELRFRRRESPCTLALAPALELLEVIAGAMVLVLMGETMVTCG